ncbi:MAG: hypothetical protein FJW61_05490, partial [Actinobacteria bacterium]|nr:hypothetical protein [Actinomycetota bacterium]
MQTVLVIDFGGQYSQLIARRVRELRVYSELISYDTPVEKIKQKKPSGIILSGSPGSIASIANVADINSTDHDSIPINISNSPFINSNSKYDSNTSGIDRTSGAKLSAKTSSKPSNFR